MSDISKVLHEWKDVSHSNIRKILGEDGTPKIQIKIDQGAFQGILQMELDGRPDGAKPHGFDYYLDYYRDKQKNNGDKLEEEVGFVLTPKDCEHLFDESFRVYNRYTFLFEIEDFRRVVRDTERNMELFRFVKNYAGFKKDQIKLERWWPYVIRMNATARMMLAMDEKDYERALQIVLETRNKIYNLENVDAQEFIVEKARSLGVLDKMEKEILEKIPKTPKEKMKDALEVAIEVEDYEKAAELRDALKELGDDHRHHASD